MDKDFPYKEDNAYLSEAVFGTERDILAIY